MFSLVKAFGEFSHIAHICSQLTHLTMTQSAEMCRELEALQLIAWLKRASRFGPRHSTWTQATIIDNRQSTIDKPVYNNFIQFSITGVQNGSICFRYLQIQFIELSKPSINHGQITRRQSSQTPEMLNLWICSFVLWTALQHSALRFLWGRGEHPGTPWLNMWCHWCHSVWETGNVINTW